MVRAFTLSLMTGAMLTACGIDPLIWGHLTRSEFDPPPPAGVNRVTGQAPELGTGAAVAFFGPAGVALAEQATTTGEGGAFAADFPATTAFINTIVTASGPTRAFWGIVPEVPAKESVQDESLTIAMGTAIDGSPVTYMDALDSDATTATLLLLARQKLATPESTLAALSPEAVIDALAEIDNLIGGEDPRVMPLYEMVARILADGATRRPALRPFPATGASFLDASALAPATDYDGDGTPDTDSAAFDDALERAVSALDFDVCYAPDRIRVVLIVDFREGGLDQNCATINRFKWTTDLPGKQMFITGALHETTPNCDTDEPPCIDSATFDAASQLMGNWSPNITPMYDDATHGDAVAGDNLWTITFDLPWFDAGSPTARWVRIGYKFTWGTNGALWTGSEEWPGNQRILELRDLTGDHMIVRQDLYGDETTNKDLSNLRAPAKGGCGTVLWQSELDPPPEGRRDNCIDDTLESMIDVDRDCTLESWPSLFSVGPITVPCEDE